MYRPLIFSAALIAATGNASWSQVGVDVPATSGSAPATSNVDVNLGIPNANTPNVPGTSLPAQTGVNSPAVDASTRANSLPSVSATAHQQTNTQADVTAQGLRVQGSATAGQNNTTGQNNPALRGNLGVDSNQNNRRDAVDRREERREDRRDGVVGDDNRRLGVDDRGANNAGNNQWRFKYHNNHWWYYQPDNSWMIYHGNSWVPYSASTYSNYYPSTRTYRSNTVYTQGYIPSNQQTYYSSPQRYGSYYRGNVGYGYNNGYYGNGYYGNGYYGNPGYYGNRGFYGNRDLRFSDGSPGGNIGATVGGAIGRDAGGRQGGNIGAAIGGAIGGGGW